MNLNSLESKLGTAILIVAIIFTIGIIITYIMISKQNQNSLLINLAGRQRYTSQRIAKNAATIGGYLGDINTANYIVDILTATREHISTTVSYLPQLELSDKTSGLIPVKAVIDITNEFRKTREVEGLKDIYIKQTSLKLRNPNNKPDSFEEKILNMFNNDKKLKEYYEYTSEQGISYFRYLKPLIVSESCIKCHGDKNKIPAYIRDKYTEDKSFGYNVGDVIGAISIKMSAVPVDIKEVRSSLVKDVEIFNQTHEAFKNGGLVEFSGEKVKISALGSNEKFKKPLQNTDNIWREFKKYVEVITKENADRNEVNLAIEYIKSNSETLLESVNQVVFETQFKAEKELSSVIRIQIGSVVLIIFSVIGLLIYIVNNVTKPIKTIVAELTTGIEQVASASSELSSAGQSLSEGASEQAASVQEMTSTISQISSSIKQNADNSAEAGKLAELMVENTEKGSRSVMEMISAMREINDSSEEMANIIKLIDDVAFQTNLLALNAAIEAARAGEYGKSFAVVADEVRNLARKTAEAAKNTSKMIQDNIQMVKMGSELADKSGEALKEILENAKKVSDIANEVKSASREQADGINQIAKAVSQTDTVTQRNASIAEESASSSEELSSQAQMLNDIVKKLALVVGIRN